MTGPQPAAEDARRFLLTGVVSRYHRDPALNRPQLAQDQRLITTLFTGEFGYTLDPRMGLDPTREQIRQALRGFAKDSDRRPDDIVAVYLAGHGEIHEAGESVREHLFLPADVDPDDLGFTAIKSADLGEWLLAGTTIRRLLIMIDTCYSGLGGLDFSRAVLDHTRWGPDRVGAADAGVVVVTATHPRQEATAGVFAAAFDRAARSQAAAGHAPQFIALDAILNVLKADPGVPATQAVTSHTLFAVDPPRMLFPNRRRAGSLIGATVAEQDAQWAAEDHRWRVRREQRRLRQQELTGQFIPRIEGSPTVGDSLSGYQLL